MKNQFSFSQFALRWIGLPVGLLISSVFARAEDAPKIIHFGEVGGTTVRAIGGKPSGSGLVNLALQLGFFEEEFGKDGPKIDEVYFVGTGPAQNEALSQGDIDFASYGGIPNVIGLIGGIPAHIVATRRSAGAGNNYYIAVRADSPFKSVADLKGKRITVQKGTNPYQTLVLLLAAHGVAEKDVSIVNLTGGDALVAFNAGAVDAVFGGANLLALRDDGKVKIIEDTKTFSQPGSASGFLVSDKFASQYPTTVERVVKVIIKTSWWASQEKNREALLQFVSARSYAYRYIQEQYAGSLKNRFNPLIDDSSIKAFREIVQFEAEHKLIRKTVSEQVIQSWFAPQYQRQALKELNLEKYWEDSDSVASIAQH